MEGCVTSGWVDFEHLRFLPTQFTLITAFRSSDNCCQLPGFPAIFPRFSSSRFRFSFKEREIPRPDPPHFHTPCEFILSLALFVPTPVNFIEIPAFWPHYPIRRKKLEENVRETWNISVHARSFYGSIKLLFDTDLRLSVLLKIGRRMFPPIYKISS